MEHLWYVRGKMPTKGSSWSPPVRFDGPDGVSWWMDLISTSGVPRARLWRALGDGWQVIYVLAPGNGLPKIVGLEVKRGDKAPLNGDAPRAGITDGILRRVRSERDVRIAAELMKERERLFPGFFSTDSGFGGFSHALDIEPVRPGRKGHPPIEYAKIAAAYVDVVESGSSKPIRDLTDVLGRNRKKAFDPEWVRELVARARVHGMLTPAPTGRAGGSLTDRARELLAGAEKARSTRKGRR